MTYILLGILIVINLRFIASKRNNPVIIAVSMVILYFIMAFNTYTSDFPAYEIYYNTQDFPPSFEIGYVVFSRIVYFIGLNYQGFLMIFFFTGLLLTLLAVKGLDANLHCAVLLYSLTNMFMDVNEIRQFIAYCFFAVALADYSKYKSKTRYALWVIASVLFHRSALLLLLFPYLVKNIINREKLLRVYFAGIMIFCIIVFANGNRIPGLNQILIVMGLPDKAVYFETSTNMGFLLFWLAYFTNIVVVYYAKIEVYKDEDNYSLVQRNYVDNLWEFLLYTAFAMPLCMLNSEFLRYYRFSVFPVIVVISVVINKKVFIREKSSYLRVIGFDACIVFYLIAYSLTFQHWRVVGEVLDNNLLNW